MLDFYRWNLERVQYTHTLYLLSRGIETFSEDPFWVRDSEIKESAMLLGKKKVNNNFLTE